MACLTLGEHGFSDGSNELTYQIVLGVFCPWDNRGYERAVADSTEETVNHQVDLFRSGPWFGHAVFSNLLMIEV